MQIMQTAMIFALCATVQSAPGVRQMLLSQSATFNEISAPTARICYAVASHETKGEKTRIVRTKNSGESWEYCSLVGVPGYARTICFIDSTTGFVGGAGGIVKTADGGESWVTVYEYPRTDLRITELVMPTADTGHALVAIRNDKLTCSFSSTTVIIDTYDGGDHWGLTRPFTCLNDTILAKKAAFSSTSSNLFYLTGAIGWYNYGAPFLIGGGRVYRLISLQKGAVYSVTDSSGCCVFTPDSLQVMHIGSFFFFDTLYGVAAVNPGGYALTNDGGFTWTRSLSMQKFGFGSMDFSFSGFGVAADGKHISISKDSGKTWQTVAQPLSPVTDVCVVRPGLAWLCGMDGYLAVCIDTMPAARASSPLPNIRPFPAATLKAQVRAGVSQHRLSGRIYSLTGRRIRNNGGTHSAGSMRVVLLAPSLIPND